MRDSRSTQRDVSASIYCTIMHLGKRQNRSNISSFHESSGAKLNTGRSVHEDTDCRVNVRLDEQHTCMTVCHIRIPTSTKHKERWYQSLEEVPRSFPKHHHGSESSVCNLMYAPLSCVIVVAPVFFGIALTCGPKPTSLSFFTITIFLPGHGLVGQTTLRDLVGTDKQCRVDGGLPRDIPVLAVRTLQLAVPTRSDIAYSTIDLHLRHRRKQTQLPNALASSPSSVVAKVRLL